MSNIARTLEKLKVLAKMKRAIFLWGPIGVGKSTVVRDLARHLWPDEDPEDTVDDVRAAYRDPTDIMGFIGRDNDTGEMIRSRPEIMPDGDHGIIFLDEINLAPPLVQAVLYELIQDRRIGKYKVPDGYIIIAAGNRREHGCPVQPMSKALGNRFISHMDVEHDVNLWNNTYAMKHEIRPEIIAFNRLRPEMHYVVDIKSQDQASATPRTWEDASHIIDACELENVTSDLESEMLRECLGNGVGSELSSFLVLYRELPDFNQIFKDPEGCPIVEDRFTQVAVVTMLAKMVDQNNVGSFFQYIARMPAELERLGVSDVVTRDVGLKATKAYSDYVIENESVAA